MPFEKVIETYGYWAIFLGTLFEGEIFVVIAGFLAHHGYLQLKLVILFALLGSLLGDQFYFYLGRRKGRKFLEKRPTWKKKIDKIQHCLEKHQNLLMLGFRLFYGFRTITPFVIGLSGIGARKFSSLNAIRAFIWAIVVSIAGFIFGKTLNLVLDELKHYEINVIVAILMIGIVIWTIQFYRKKKSIQ